MEPQMNSLSISNDGLELLLGIVLIVLVALFLMGYGYILWNFKGAPHNDEDPYDDYFD